LIDKKNVWQSATVVNVVTLLLISPFIRKNALAYYTNNRKWPVYVRTY